MAKSKHKEQHQTNSNGIVYAFVILLPMLLISVLYSTKAVDAVLLPKFIAFAIFSIAINALALKNVASFNIVKQHLFFKIYVAYLIKYVGKQYMDNTSNELRKLDPFFVNDLF